MISHGASFQIFVEQSPIRPFCIYLEKGKALSENKNGRIYLIVCTIEILATGQNCRNWLQSVNSLAKRNIFL
jgi:hypothetical protein